MRRRGTTSHVGIMYGTHKDHSIPGNGPPPTDTKPGDTTVPQAWRDNAHQPWRVLVPDLNWNPPDRDL